MQASFRSTTNPLVNDAREPRSARSGTPQTTTAAGFRQALLSASQPADSLRSAPAAYVVREGDTLSAIALERLRQAGEPVGRSAINRAVQEIAVANGIDNPDRIFVGQRLSLGALNPSAAPASARAGAPFVEPNIGPPAPLRPIEQRAGAAPAGAVFPQLEKTLDRAVDRGYIEAKERPAVRDRIVELGRKYRFSPDDFATVSLMESDGLNPRATNGRCHGIIQFCEGGGSGAASVGMQGRAQEIGKQSVLEQLNLVDRYFEDTGLREMGPVSLVDLYLTILTPAARSERRPNAALDIAGSQARVLHDQGDRTSPMTRNSIFAGLQSHASQRLGAVGGQFAAVGAPASPGLAPSAAAARVTAMRGWHPNNFNQRLAGLDSTGVLPPPLPRAPRQG